MITITLQFSTQEEAIAYLTGATKAKAEATQAIEKAAKAPKPVKAEAPVAPTPTATETATPTPPAEPARSEPATESPSEISYDVVQKAITNKAKTDRETVIALLAKFGVKKGTELKVEQYAAILAELA